MCGPWEPISQSLHPIGRSPNCIASCIPFLNKEKKERKECIERGAVYLARASHFSNLILLPSIFKQRLESVGFAGDGKNSHTGYCAQALDGMGVGGMGHGYGETVMVAANGRAAKF